MRNYRLSEQDLKFYNIDHHSREPFGKALKRLRDITGLTQNELGKLLGITGVTINNYEHGYRKNPEPDFVVSVATCFDIKPTYFREYRIYKLLQRLNEYPGLIDLFLDIANNPNPNKFLQGYREYKKRDDAFKASLLG